MLVLFRGHSTFTEVPDQPTAPVTTAMVPLLRGFDAPADTHLTADQSITHAGSIGPALTVSDWSAGLNIPSTHADGLAVPSAVTDVHTTGIARDDLGGSVDGGGDVVRSGDDNGWFVVPSAANEYGQVYAVADGFGFDAAAGEFSAADWFLA